jgi:hypothetical protein
MAGDHVPRSYRIGIPFLFSGVALIALAWAFAPHKN